MRKVCGHLSSILAVMLALSVSGCRRALQQTESMMPTIQPGELLKLDAKAYTKAAPQRWDVVMLNLSNHLVIKRVVALPGETVAFTNGGITLNGQPLLPPQTLSNVTYVALDHPTMSSTRSSIASPYFVPKDSYFVLGDNSPRSLDSRFYGAIPRTNIVAKVEGK